ncbi:metal transporter [Halostella litorea]|uniref:metal transporter n=1 Tax=Halostella litorea TaxID=2528831 RepID=UPI001091E238|nr:metal transporter [Halostella litorea]
MTTAAVDRRPLAGLVALVALSPAFAWAAEAVGYAEPMENAAARAGVAADPLVGGLFPGYAVPGVGALAGTAAAGLIGTAVTLVAALALARGLRAARRSGEP